MILAFLAFIARAISLFVEILATPGFEGWFSIMGSGIILGCAALRVNLLSYQRHAVHLWLVLEVLGLAGLMCGQAGSIAEWFLPNAEFHSETIVNLSTAAFAIGLTRFNLCQVAARLLGWDGGDRRAVPRDATRISAEELTAHRVR